MTAALSTASPIPFPRPLGARNPFAGPSRTALVVVVWLSFSLLQAALLVAAATGPRRTWAFFALYGAIGLGWALMTFPVGALVATLRADAASAPRVVAAHAAALIACGVVDTLVRREATVLLGGQVVIAWYGTLLYFADRTFVGYVLIVVLSRTLEAHDRFVARERQALALQAQLARAKLSSLEEQLHPHFLFNCLGAVAELAHEAPAAASRMLRQLASVLRFGLQRGGGEVTVIEELAGLEPYLEVQRTRFSDWLTIETQVSDGARDLLVPPLVLQPLVENAIRHGLVNRDAAGQIRISASTTGDHLVLEVRDNGVGLRGPRPAASRGIGTSNLRDRLAALYGSRADLALFEEQGGGAVSRVTIPAHHQAEVSSTGSVLPESGEDRPLIPRFLSDRPVVGIVISWAVWGLLWTQQSIAYMAFRGRLGDRTFAEIALNDFATAMLWAAVTPLMLLALRLVPLRSERIGLRLIVHGAFAALVAMLHGWLTQKVLLWETGVFTSEGVAAIGWGVLAYAVVLAVAHHGQIRAWLRERELADARMRVGIAEAELHATTARARPQQLLERLETIAASIQADAAGAERALARLGDELRETLDARVPA